METTTIVACGLSAVAGGATHWAWATYVWPNRHRTYTWVYTLRPHRRLGRPCASDLELDREGYSLGYSFKQKAALWVSFIVSKGSVGVDMDRGERFYADLDVPEAHRATPEDFRNTGYDRGHLAPSAAIDFSRKSNDETFAMSNIVLQHPKLNRQAWGSLERMVREWTGSKGTLAVVAGPVFGPQPRRVNGVAVPKSFYQVVYSFQHKRCIGFVVENNEADSREIWDDALSVADVEKATGYTFFKSTGWFSGLSDRDKQKLDVDWWKGKKRR